MQVVALVPVRRPGAAAEHGGDARHQGLFYLLRTDKMNMGVDTAGGGNLPFAGDRFGARPDDNIHVRAEYPDCRLCR